jgi:hypothetical protein
MSDAVIGTAPAAPVSDAIAPAQTAEKPANVMDSIEKSMSVAYDKINPPRENGKFVAKDKPEVSADVAAEKPADTATQTTDQNPAPAPVEPVRAIDAPLSWSAEMKAKWGSVPPDVQPFVAQREAEAHKRISELGQQVKTFEPYRSIEERFKGVIQKNNLRPVDAVARAMAVAEMFEENAENAIQELAKAYGVNLSVGQAAPSEPGAENSAAYRALEAKYSALERRLAQTDSKVTARERSEQEQTRAALDKLVSDFSKDKADLADIEGDFVAHISAIRQSEPDLSHEKVLEKAYEAARWANPNTRTKLLAEQDKQRTEKAEAEQKKKAAEAKKVGSLNVKSTAASPAKKGNWEATLREVGERIA